MAEASISPSTSGSSTTAHLPLVVYVLTVGTFLMGTSEFIVAGLLPEIAADYNVSVAQVGMAITLFAIGMIFGAPTVALFTLRMPKRIILMLSLVVFAIGHLIAAFTTDFTVLLVSRVVSAVATSSFWTVAAVVASKAAGSKASARALGIVIGGGMLANVLGVPLGSIAGQIAGWRGPFWALAIIAVVLAIAIIKLVPAEVSGRTIPRIRDEFAGLRSIRLWLSLLGCVTVNAGALSVYSFIAPLLTEHTGLASQFIPIALALFGVASLIGSIFGGRIGDRHPHTMPMFTAGISALASAGLLAFSSIPAAALIMFTLLGLVGLAANPVLTSLAVGYGGNSPTLASSMVVSFFNVGTALGTWITGMLIETQLGVLAPPLVGVIFGVLTFVPVVIVAVLERRRPILRNTFMAPDEVI
ncbi:DHA1 family inner membrane transport protein [Xanthomonas arboricola]|uniref:MFS transporter n=1 Tax=Xanthomonas arboricola TaxID=56448 RepID=UPI00141AD201|nr:MFS transporter [Xanthomonas arboricola]NIJ84923.1 DHA1 family inner membrane transport protein [Xanthomonas arboricola]